jgi:hypothetical protein
MMSGYRPPFAIRRCLCYVIAAEIDVAIEIAALSFVY